MIRPARRAFALQLAVYSVATAVVVAVGVRAQGMFVYAVDDAAIHLTLARNLARHGTFGLVPGVYESASSAPLWEILLAPVLYVAPGAWWLPLLVNVAAAMWILWLLARVPLVGRLGERGVGAAAVAVLPIGLGLVPLTLAGMEHTLQAAVVLAALGLLAGWAAGREGRLGAVAFYGAVAVGTLLRFETAFVAAGMALAVLVAVDRPLASRVRRAVGAMAAAAVPLLCFAALNLAFGQFALPNSVVAKTALGGRGLPVPSPVEAVGKLLGDPLLVLLLAAAVGVAVATRPWRATRERGAEVVALVAVVPAAVLHLLFADVGWFERYQAYLVAALAYGLLRALPAVREGRVPPRAVAVTVLVLSVLRVPLLLLTPTATYNVYENQVQLGSFLARNYDGRGVAVNDIGYVGWLHDGELVDAAGLGSHEVLAARKAGTLDASSFGQILDRHGVEVLAVYDDFFAPLVPAGWRKVGSWCVQTRRYVLSAQCVSFYGRAGDGAAALAAALAGDAGRLPDGVAWQPA